jgi:hypothetical protein
MPAGTVKRSGHLIAADCYLACQRLGGDDSEVQNVATHASLKRPRASHGARGDLNRFFNFWPLLFKIQSDVHMRDS